MNAAVGVNVEVTGINSRRSWALRSPIRREIVREILCCWCGGKYALGNTVVSSGSWKNNKSVETTI